MTEPRSALTEPEADQFEAELRRLEADVSVTKTAFRLFLQGRMPCGHPVHDLLTCPDPPFGCVTCNEIERLRADVTRLAQENARLRALRPDKS